MLGRGSRADCCNGFGLAQNRSRLFIYGRPPDVGATPTVTREVQVLPIGRPYWIPIYAGAIGDPNSLGSVGGYGPNVLASPAQLGTAPVSDSVSVRRPVGLKRVRFCDQAFLAGGNSYHPQLAARRSSLRLCDAFSSEENLLTIRRPGRIIAGIRDAP